jgi:hypothetical protein
MNILRFLSVVIAATVVLMLPAQAEPNRVTFPKNFEKYVFYGDYRRGSSGEMAYALPETLQIAKSGQSMPYGTQLVLAIMRDNAVSSYFVMEKGAGFGLDYNEERRTADWQFQQFDLKGQAMASSNSQRCQSCHSSQAATEYLFTLDRMKSYVP